MTIILIITLLILIIMPFALYFETLNEFFDRIKIIISNFIKKRKETKQKKTLEIEYQEKIDKLNEQIENLQAEKEISCQEIENLKQELKNQEKELTKVIENKNRIIDDVKKDFLKQDQEREEIIKKLQTINMTLEIENKTLKEQKETKPQYEKKNHKKDFRKKYPADIRCQDGDYVRSKSERDIDDFFFQNKIWHIYEPTYIEPTTQKKHYPDFYLPDYNLYIEYFGMTDPKYLENRERKITMYLSDNSINFEYLTQADDNDIYEKLKEICQKHSIPIK